MARSKKWLFLLIIAILLFTFYKPVKQIIDQRIYAHKMRLIDSLSYYNMKNYDTLYHIATLDTVHGNYKEDYYGWINQRKKDGNLLLLKVNGTELDVNKKEIAKPKALSINDTTIAIFKRILKEDVGYELDNFGQFYLLNLWLYQKGKVEYSKQTQTNKFFFTDSTLINNFGIIYYDAMLSAFAQQRDYTKAIDFGNHLSKPVFKGYQYQKVAMALTRQLKQSSEDFKIFNMPDSLQWQALKQKLDRKQQIIYLADRLKLLNCIQDSQPGGISYSMPQYAISYTRTTQLGIPYRDTGKKYRVINPFVELIKMKPNLLEMELLLPYLLSETYIPSYHYFRDFFPDRTLHKVSWVVYNLIFEINNKRFPELNGLDDFSAESKKAAVAKVKRWYDENAALSEESLTVKTLKTTDQWAEFEKAAETAKKEKYSALLPVIVTRFNDFEGKKQLDYGAPPHKATMANLMFDLGDNRYIPIVKQWNQDTTETWVNLWASLFLLKYDKQSYGPAMTELEAILKKCDGTYYYPKAMDLLLSMNDKRALKLAEKIMDKQQFQTMLNWPYYLDFIKKLLLLKSDYTFNAITKKLEAPFTPEEIRDSKKHDNWLTESDLYVLAVDALKNTKPDYDDIFNDIKAKSAYKKMLSKWFATQYNLLKNGKPNQLHLNLVRTNEPVRYLDAPR